jgi:pyridoxine 5-phosphate synthase
MIKLSVNVNKVATLRNSRGGTVPSVLDAVDVCIAAGAPGITVHPRADERHITRQDTHDIAAHLGYGDGRRHQNTRAERERSAGIEFNIEGDPRPDLIELVLATRPTQCTLVPVTPGEITSHAGWSADTSPERLTAIVKRLQMDGIRVSIFVDPLEAPIRWAKRVGADRVELYTEPFARDFAKGGAFARSAFDMFAAAAELAHSLGLGINAGHDLDLDNLVVFRSLPHLDEVSIGHALISRALFRGLDTVVREYLDVLDPTARANR